MITSMKRPASERRIGHNEYDDGLGRYTLRTFLRDGALWFVLTYLLVNMFLHSDTKL